MNGGPVSGDVVTFVGDAMSSVVRGIEEVRAAIDQPPVIVGGLAVLARLSRPYRATVDLDVVDRLRGVRHLELLRAAEGATPVEPAAVFLETPFGGVKVDVLEVRQVEIDEPSDDPGDRLHATSHAWAYDTATELTLEALPLNGGRVRATTPVAEPGPLVAMKLQAVMNRSSEKQGTDLLDIVRLVTDKMTGERALNQIAGTRREIAHDISLHVNLWFERERSRTLRWIHQVGGSDITADDVELVAELLVEASS